MIDFNGKGFFARLREVQDSEYLPLIEPFLIDGEQILGTYKSIRDGVVFTNARIITINIQGFTGKKIDYTSIPYKKITAFSIENAGVFDLDAELEIYVSAVGKIVFQFTGLTNVSAVCKIISIYALT